MIQLVKVSMSIFKRVLDNVVAGGLLLAVNGQITVDAFP